MKAYMPITLLIVGILIGVPSFVGIHSGRLDASEATLVPEHILSTNSDGYDMVIIAPEIFSDALQLLIDHKNSHGVETFLKTTEEIYLDYSGRDNAERIKYFIKDAIKTWGVSYVMLVGSVDKLPMRTVKWDFGGTWEIIDMLTDLYYSDVFDAENNFCSWDSNNNGEFGDDGDQLDFYPDVHIGRLACNNNREVDIVVDKIIHYETETFGQKWFKNMILMGGDTFPEDEFPGAEGREGEIHNTIIMELMPEFNHTTIWTSKENFNRKNIAEEVNKGAGFLFYSGHGREYLLLPEGDSSNRDYYYYRRYINDFSNEYKLPIMFVTACLTAKLDFSFGDLLPFPFSWIISFLPTIDSVLRMPCFSWGLIAHDGGGAIATIGSTNLILSSTFNPAENPTGCHKPPIFFFNAYNSSLTLGQIMTKAIDEMILEIPYDDLAAYTAEEHILLGDPSLKIGGYP